MKKFIASFITVLIVSVFFVYQYNSPVPSTPESNFIEEVGKIVDTDAFKAIQYIDNGSWEITLHPKYFSEITKSVSVNFNNVEYGIFILTDKIHLPILFTPADLIITSLDENGTPLSSETFTLEESLNEIPTSPEQPSQTL